MSNHKERGKKLPCGFGLKRDKIPQVVIYPFAMLTTFQESRWLGKSSRWEYQCHRQGPLPPLLGNLLAKITSIEKLKLPDGQNCKQGVDDSLHLLTCVRRHSWGSR